MELGWLQMMSSLDQKCHSVEQTFIKTLHYLEHTKKTKIKPVIKMRYVALCKGSLQKKSLIFVTGTNFY